MSNNINQDRLKYLQNHFDNQLVKVECPTFRSETTKGVVVRYFEEERFGYKFNHGTAYVRKEDLHLFREYYPHFIIHDTKGEK